MASIEDQLRNVRTLEDIVNILAILFNNMNSISRVYYDIFLNNTPMLVPVKLYDDNGVLVDREIPNVAYYRTGVIFCDGSPEGVIAADAGKFCIDTSNNDLYYKASGTDATGWKKIYSNNSDEFLTPTSEAPRLRKLNMDNAGSGILSVLRGGTGVSIDSNFTGLIRANGTEPFSKATPNIDYVSPASMVGVVSHYAGDIDIPEGYDEENPTPIVVNNGWLVCNGAIVSIDNYGELYKKIGTKYGGDGIGTFGLPNLIGCYVKGNIEADGNTKAATVGKHSHDLGNARITPEDKHTHGPGTYEITGVAGTSWMSKSKLQNPANQFKGCFFKIDSGTKFNWDSNYSVVSDSTVKYYGVNDNSTSNNDPGMGFQASRHWVGESAPTSHKHNLEGTTSPNISEDLENDVKHLDMIPIIKF